MAARKLQTEVDRVLKRVAEGVEQFDEQYKKIQATTNVAHKEKLEAELKTQIKKLQRLRDQIKTWLASNEIKDKKALTDNRKLIEQQMERFKACEKEMKTKAFSKEGLNAGTKLDPKEALKVETSSFISNMVDELSRQLEVTEAEVEQLQGGAKKSKKDAKANGDRVAQLEDMNERRKWHVSKLELILRLLENGNLDPDRVQTLKEDISYFVESNTEEDFEEDEGIYDELNLDEQEEAFGMGERDDVLSSHDSMSVADTSELTPPIAPPIRTPAKSVKPPERSSSASTAKDAPALPLASTATPEEGGEKSPTATKTKTSTTGQRKPTLDGTAQRPTGLSGPTRALSGSQPSSSATTTTTTTRVPAVLPPIRYAAAAASAVALPQAAAAASPAATAGSSIAPSSANNQTTAASTPTAIAPATITSPTSTIPPTSTLSQASQAPADALSPTPAPKAAPATLISDVAPSPAPSYASVPQSAASGLHSVTSPTFASPKLSTASPPPHNALLSVHQASESVTAAAQSDRSTTPSSLAKEAVPSSRASPSVSNQQRADQPSTETRLPSSLADLVTTFESAKQKSLNRDNDLSAVHEILDAGYSNIPQPSDADKPKYYIPRNPFPTPAYYPQQPSPHLANPALIAKFDVETLFYIFYYCQGTYMQYLAAQELKKQSWRFHKQYLTWFQRANEPATITDEYEQGVYLYFDFEGSWAQRRKENFSFFYRHLEE